MQQWEYNILSLSDPMSELSARLDEFGRFGWEAYHVVEGLRTITVYLKRPVEDDRYTTRLEPPLLDQSEND